MLCGPKVRPDKAGGFRRAGSEPGRVFVNGRKEKVTRPRVRTDDGEEVKLETYQAAGSRRGLFEAVVEAVAVGLPVRGVECGHGGAVKRTQPSRMWPDAVQQECLVHAQRVTLAKLPRKARDEAVRLFRRGDVPTTVKSQEGRLIGWL